MKRIFLFLIVHLTVATLFFACDSDDDNVIPLPNPDPINSSTALSTRLNGILNNSEVPGFAVSVVKENEIIFQEAFGYADVENKQLYTNKTTQPIGSISKTFIAAAIVKAIEQGHFSLESDINEILPVEVKNPRFPDAPIKVRHLVTHTSGLLDDIEAYFQAYHILPGEDLSTDGAQLLQNGFGVQQRSSIPLEDFLAEYYLENGDLYSMNNFGVTAPGDAWNYSNIASSLAAYLVEAATGMSFKEYVQINILKPLNMEHSAYGLADLDPAQAAKLYWDRNTPLPVYNNDSYPDASVNTSNEDLAKYLLDMMKGAQRRSADLFSQAGYDLLFEALLPANTTPAGIGENQGVFWFLNGDNIKHDGADPGTTCNLQFDQNGNAGYLLLTNMDASTDEHEAAWFELAAAIDNAIAEFIQAN